MSQLVRSLVPVVVAVLVCASALPALAAAHKESLELPSEATPAVVPVVALPPPPDVLWWRLWPLAGPERSATGGPPERSALVAAMAQGRHAAACNLAMTFWQQRMREAAGLFYAPVRKGADTTAISAFLARWLRGPTPLLAVVAEGFALAPRYRDLAATACAKSGRWLDSETLLRPSALDARATTVRLAIALLRWRASGDLRGAAWWLGEGGGGAVIAMLRQWGRGAGAGEMSPPAGAAESALLTDLRDWHRGLSGVTSP